jgi:DNA-binding NarL/FixJ family response regulator
MPGGGGIAAAWEISARLPETRIVILTVSDESRDVLAALRAGAVGYLLKDMDFERLPAALWDVAHGEATIPRTLLADVLAQFRDPSANWRSRASEEDGPKLTSREWEILELHQQGLSTAQIARRLSLTPATVRSHRARLVRKLSGSRTPPP